jgi:hypothetical protein
MFFLKIHFWVVLRSGAPHIGSARVAGEEEDDVGLLRIRVEKRRQYGQRGQQRRKSSDRNLVQFGAIWCNLVQFGAIPGRELQSGCGRIALAFVKIAPDGIALPAWDGDGASL